MHTPWYPTQEDYEAVESPYIELDHELAETQEPWWTSDDEDHACSLDENE